MNTLKTLFTICLLIVGGQTFAQNTGLLPYENSTHTYSITKGTVGTSTVAWSISPGAQGTDWNIVSGAGTKDIEIQWLKAATYTLQLTETRTDYTGGCPTMREIEVTVGTNGFDVIAALNKPLDIIACATVGNPVADDGVLGSNADDVFGTTERVFKVSSTGLAATTKWEFNYAITHVLDAGIGNYSVTVDPTNVVDASASPIVVNAGATEVLIKVSYTTNNKRQDKDFDLLLALTDAKDETGTPEKDNGLATNNNSISYSVKALPATTGITTDY